MIKVTCFKCDEELNEPGGLCFSPPWEDNFNSVGKLHLCRRCWNSFVAWTAES